MKIKPIPEWVLFITALISVAIIFYLTLKK